MFEKSIQGLLLLFIYINIVFLRPILPLTSLKISIKILIFGTEIILFFISWILMLNLNDVKYWSPWDHPYFPKSLNCYKCISLKGDVLFCTSEETSDKNDFSSPFWKHGRQARDTGSFTKGWAGTVCLDSSSTLQSDGPETQQQTDFTTDPTGCFLLNLHDLEEFLR